MNFVRCYYCMHELDKANWRCPHCGRDNAANARNQAAHALPCGTLLHEQFVIGCMLGQGGFGITYIGWDLKMEQRVCIKEYFPAGAAMRDAYRGTAVFWSSGQNAAALKLGRESFFREARKAVKLRDLPTMVKVWDVFYENETAYLVMDYVEGVTLNKYLLKTKKPLNERECIHLFSPVIRDLEEAHSRGIIHRDISPDNLMLRPDGTLVLLDIGAAKDITVGSGQSTRPVVKHGFSPEEQYVPDESIGPWTDVYSMCATMVYCITGQVLPTPFERLRGREIDLSAFTPNVAETLRAGLAVRHEERIQSMKELAARLCSSSQVNPSKWKCRFCGATNLDSASFCGKCGKKHTSLPPTPPPYLKLLVFVCALVIASLAVWRYVSASERQAAPTLAPSAQETTAPRVVTPTPPTYTESVFQVSTPNAPAVTAVPKEEIHWNLDNGELIISGSGRMPDYSTQDAPWRSKAEMANSIKSIIVQDGVTHIGSQAFQYCANVKSVSMAGSVESVGKAAFYGCSNLESVDFPSKMRDDELAISLFDRCTALKYFKIPEGITVIRNAAFNRCASLEWVYIPASVRIIEDSAFNGCGSLKEVYYGGSMAEWENIEISTYNKYLKNADVHFGSALN